jgi:hypothetical protein
MIARSNITIGLPERDLTHPYFLQMVSRETYWDAVFCRYPVSVTEEKFILGLGILQCHVLIGELQSVIMVPWGTIPIIPAYNGQ